MLTFQLECLDKDQLIEELTIPNDKITILEKIGEGAFGVVMKATVQTGIFV